MACPRSRSFCSKHAKHKNEEVVVESSCEDWASEQDKNCDQEVDGEERPITLVGRYT